MPGKPHFRSSTHGSKRGARCLAAFVAAALAGALIAGPASGAVEQSDYEGKGLGPYPYDPDAILVKFNEVPSTNWLDVFLADNELKLVEFDPAIQWFGFEILDDVTVVEKMDQLERHPSVAAVSANGGGEVATPPEIVEETAIELSFYPNDPYYPDQWYLPRMDVPQAWDHAGGGTTTPMVFVDTGMYNHPELGHIVHANFTDVAYADTCGSWGHGTVMAGIAAAYTNNGAGIAGISYNSPIYSAKVIDGCSRVFSSWVANGITWAVNQGGKAINASFVVNDSPRVEDAVNYAWNNGALVSAATGNSGSDSFDGLAPAMYLTAVAVGGTQTNDCRHPSSNYGYPGPDVVAPAENIVSTTNSGGYVTWGFGGTSSSAALTTGVIGLMVAHFPGESASQLKTRLHNGTDLVCGQTGYNYELGYGRVNAYKSVAQD